MCNWLKRLFRKRYIVIGDTEPEPGGFLSGPDVLFLGTYRTFFFAVRHAEIHVQVRRDECGEAWIYPLDRA